VDQAAHGPRHHLRVSEKFLGDRHLAQYVKLFAGRCRVESGEIV
jgi:hypothetical protein